MGCERDKQERAVTERWNTGLNMTSAKEVAIDKYRVLFVLN